MGCKASVDLLIIGFLRNVLWHAAESCMCCIFCQVHCSVPRALLINTKTTHAHELRQVALSGFLPCRESVTTHIILKPGAQYHSRNER